MTCSSWEPSSKIQQTGKHEVTAYKLCVTLARQVQKKQWHKKKPKMFESENFLSFCSQAQNFDLSDKLAETHTFKHTSNQTGHWH